MNTFFFLYLPSEKYNLNFVWHKLVLHGFDIFIHVVSFIILL